MTCRDRTTPMGNFALLVDDDVELGELLQDALDEHGIRVEVAHDGRRGLARALSGEHDLLLLDGMLPGLDGLELLRLVRRQSRVPVIMLTARTAAADQVAGLDAGADDYLPKPFGTELLMARIRAVLRRSGRAIEESNVLEAGGFRLLLGPRGSGRRLAGRLTTVEYDILEYLARAAGRIVPRDELMIALFQRRATPFDRALDTHICNLRKKLGRRGEAIGTVRGVGYLLRVRAGGTDEMRSILVTILLWAFATIALCIAGLWLTAKALERSRPRGKDPVMSVVGMLEEDARRAFDEDGADGLATICDRSTRSCRASDSWPTPRVRTWSTGPIEPPSSGPSAPDPPALPTADSRSSQPFDGRYRFIWIIEPWFEMPSATPFIAVVVAINAIMGTALAFYLSHPLRRLRQVMDRFGRGDLQARAAHDAATRSAWSPASSTSWPSASRR